MGDKAEADDAEEARAHLLKLGTEAKDERSVERKIDALLGVFATTENAVVGESSGTAIEVPVGLLPYATRRAGERFVEHFGEDRMWARPTVTSSVYRGTVGYVTVTSMYRGV